MDHAPYTHGAIASFQRVQQAHGRSEEALDSQEIRLSMELDTQRGEPQFLAMDQLNGTEPGFEDRGNAALKGMQNVKNELIREDWISQPW